MEIRPVVPSSAPAPAMSAAVQGEEVRPATGREIQDPAAPVRAIGPAPKEDLSQAVKSINAMLQDRSPGLEFSIDDTTGESVIKVVDKSTGDVIRQMPSLEAIELAKALDKLQSLLIRDVA